MGDHDHGQKQGQAGRIRLPFCPPGSCWYLPVAEPHGSHRAKELKWWILERSTFQATAKGGAQWRMDLKANKITTIPSVAHCFLLPLVSCFHSARHTCFHINGKLFCIQFSKSPHQPTIPFVPCSISLLTCPPILMPIYYMSLPQNKHSNLPQILTLVFLTSSLHCGFVLHQLRKHLSWLDSSLEI